MKNILPGIIYCILQLTLSDLYALNESKNILKSFNLPHTFVNDFPSKSNGINYRLYIHLPKNYENTFETYPVIYLLDADYSFLLTKQIIEHLSDRNRIEKHIIIGISYADSEYKKNRTRDYTPSHTLSGGYGPEYQKYSGGAEKFYQFIQTELIPYISSQYRAGKNTTFTGHSFGGLFGIYLLLHHPETFNNYIIVSPSLWYDNHFIVKNAKNKQNFAQDKPIKLMLFIGDKENGGDYKMVDDLKNLDALINQKKHPNLSTILRILPDLDHDTVFPVALTFGLMAGS